MDIYEDDIECIDEREEEFNSMFGWDDEDLDMAWLFEQHERGLGMTPLSLDYLSAKQLRSFYTLIFFLW